MVRISSKFYRFTFLQPKIVIFLQHCCNIVTGLWQHTKNRKYISVSTSSGSHILTTYNVKSQQCYNLPKHCHNIVTMLLQYCTNIKYNMVRASSGVHILVFLWHKIALLLQDHCYIFSTKRLNYMLSTHKLAMSSCD